MELNLSLTHTPAPAAAVCDLCPWCLTFADDFYCLTPKMSAAPWVHKSGAKPCPPAPAAQACVGLLTASHRFWCSAGLAGQSTAGRHLLSLELMQSLIAPVIRRPQLGLKATVTSAGQWWYWNHRQEVQHEFIWWFNPLSFDLSQLTAHY